MRIHGIKLDYIQQMRAAGYTELAAKDFIEMKIHGVTPDLVAELKKAGYDLPAKKVVEMKIHGVSPAYIKELNSFRLEARCLADSRNEDPWSTDRSSSKEARNLGFNFTARGSSVSFESTVSMDRICGRLKNSGFRRFDGGQNSEAEDSRDRLNGTDKLRRGYGSTQAARCVSSVSIVRFGQAGHRRARKVIPSMMRRHFSRRIARPVIQGKAVRRRLQSCTG